MCIRVRTETGFGAGITMRPSRSQLGTLISELIYTLPPPFAVGRLHGRKLVGRRGSRAGPLVLV